LPAHAANDDRSDTPNRGGWQGKFSTHRIFSQNPPGAPPPRPRTGEKILKFIRRAATFPPHRNGGKSTTYPSRRTQYL
jgi:hypothetical protein